MNEMTEEREKTGDKTERRDSKHDSKGRNKVKDERQERSQREWGRVHGIYDIPRDFLEATLVFIVNRLFPINWFYQPTR